MSAQELRTLRDSGMDLVGMTDKKLRLAWHPDTPEVDSIGEHLVSLKQRYEIPDEDILPLYRLWREFLQLEVAEQQIQRDVLVPVSDSLLRAERAKTRPQLADADPSLKRLANTLRPHLQVLRDPAGHDAATLIKARRTVADIVRRTPAARLTCPTMLTQLRQANHTTLMTFVRGADDAR